MKNYFLLVLSLATMPFSLIAMKKEDIQPKTPYTSPPASPRNEEHNLNRQLSRSGGGYEKLRRSSSQEGHGRKKETIINMTFDCVNQSALEMLDKARRINLNDSQSTKLSLGDPLVITRLTEEKNKFFQNMHTFERIQAEKGDDLSEEEAKLSMSEFDYVAAQMALLTTTTSLNFTHSAVYEKSH